MVHSDHRYALSLYLDDGTPAGEVPVANMDWVPATEAAWLAGVRCGELPPDGALESRTVEPVWDSRSGPPRVESIRATVAEEGGGRGRCEVPITYFADPATQASAMLVKKGTLKEGDLFRYSVSAFPGQDRRKVESRIRVDPVTPRLPIRESRLADFVARSRWLGAPDGPDGQVPVFIPARIVEAVVDQARQAGAVETGAIFVGNVHRDASVPDLFIEVTASIPAKHTRPEATRLVFTPDTWQAVEDAIDLRGMDESHLGWAHSHPSGEQDGAQEKQEEHKSKGSGQTGLFFSADDCQMHRTCFPRAYSIALVVAGSQSQMETALFGWSNGVIRSRGFYELQEARPVSPQRP